MRTIHVVRRSRRCFAVHLTRRVARFVSMFKAAEHSSAPPPPPARHNYCMRPPRHPDRRTWHVQVRPNTQCGGRRPGRFSIIQCRDTAMMRPTQLGAIRQRAEQSRPDDCVDRTPPRRSPLPPAEHHDHLNMDHLGTNGATTSQRTDL